jgi:hypothetical protein
MKKFTLPTIASIECACHGEGIMVTNHKGEEFVEMAFFCKSENGIGPNTEKLSFGQKLRYIWHILITGKPYGDMVILNRENTKLLCNTLFRILMDNKTI